jgi:N-acetyl-gamma-glutamyl-phosphate reductase
MQSMMIKVGIIGGAGYTGGELIRLLINHPDAEISYVHSKSQAGKPITAVHTDMVGETDITFTGNLDKKSDIVFLCVGHGEAKAFLAEHSFDKGTKIIDLSQDYRLHIDGARKQYQGADFIYGLPELNKAQIKTAQHIANPGCFATTIQLGLLPLAKAGLLKDVYTTGITGSTGAGQSLQASSHFSWRANNIQAYKTLTHQHIAEIKQSLMQEQNGKSDVVISFVPWRGDFTRGIFVSSQMHCDKTQEEIQQLFEDYYKGHPFTVVSKAPIHLKQVVNTNKCVIQIEKVDGQVVIHTAIDNLLKGASGQAVQNMNIMFGLDERAGLHLKASNF